MISEHLKECAFIQVNKNSKIPYTEFKGDDWNEKIISYDSANQLLREGWNVGLVATNNVIIIDADRPESVKWCDDNLPETYVEETCSGGKHYIFKVEEEIPNSKIPKDMGEIRCNRQFVVCAPSKAESKITKTIEPYVVIKDLSLNFITKDIIDNLIKFFEKAEQQYEIKDKTVNKEYIENNIFPKLSSFTLELIKNLKTKAELNKLGYHSRSERDMKIVTHLVNRNFGEYVFSIFINYPCGDKYREHNSGDLYLKKTIQEAIKYLGLRNKDDMDLEFEIETTNVLWLKRKLDSYLLRIGSIVDNKDLFKERLIATLAFRVKIKQQKLEARINTLIEDSKPKEIISLLDIHDREYKEHEYWLKPLLPKGVIIMLGSKPGEGKSLFVQAMITSLLLTKKFIGYTTDNLPKILLYSIDDSSEMILQSRNKYITKGIIDKTENYSFEDLKNCKITFNFNKSNVKKEVSDCLNYDVIIIDSYRRVLTGTENDSDITDNFFNNFLQPLKRAGKTIILIHHLKKGNLEDLNIEDFLEQFRGSGDIGAQLDLGYTLKSVPVVAPNKTLEIKDNYLYICKNRLGLRFENLDGQYTSLICYRIIKDNEQKMTTFEYLDAKEIKSPRERRYDLIYNIIKEDGNISRLKLYSRIKNTTDVSERQIARDLDDMVKSEMVIKKRHGLYTIIDDTDENDKDQNNDKQNFLSFDKSK